MELEARVQFTDSFGMNLGAGYTDARMAEDAPTVSASKGERLPTSPKFNGNLSLQYDFRIGDRAAFLRTDLGYVGSYLGSFSASAREAGGYARLDARIGLTTLNGIDIEVFGSNLTNEDDFTFLESRPTNIGYRVRPRTIGAQLRYSF